MSDNRVCRICDGVPGNNCACLCGFEYWDAPVYVGLIRDLLEALNAENPLAYPDLIVRAQSFLSATC